MSVPYVPQTTFNAMWALAEAVFAPGYWVRETDTDEFDRRIKVARTEEERVETTVLDDHTSHVIPLTGHMSVCTTGGLMIDFTDGWPAWIETPWGEWECFGRNWQSLIDWKQEYQHLPLGARMSWNPRKASLKTLWKFVRTLDIDFERSYGLSEKDVKSSGAPPVNVMRIALRSVSGVELPQYESQGARRSGMYDEKVEKAWIELSAHATPVRYAPLGVHYRQKVALPAGHPGRNSEEYNRMKEYLPS